MLGVDFGGGLQRQQLGLVVYPIEDESARHGHKLPGDELQKSARSIPTTYINKKLCAVITQIYLCGQFIIRYKKKLITHMNLHVVYISKHGREKAQDEIEIEP